MEFSVYRDLASLAFVRCTTPIPGTRYRAEGVSFLVAHAIAKCRSERIEAQFQLAHPDCSKILGIAAHPQAAPADEHAWNEALETLVLESLVASPVFYGIRIPLFRTKMCLGRVDGRFIALALFSHQEVLTATQAVSRNPFKALLKAWTEVRNIRIYNPSAQRLPHYTKANRILSPLQLSRISILPSLRENFADVTGLKKLRHSVDGHQIAYIVKETQ